MSSGQELAREFLEQAGRGEILPAYVFIGQGPLVRPYIDSLVKILLPEDARDVNLEMLSGDACQPDRIAQSLGTMGLFPGRRVLVCHDPSFLGQGQSEESAERFRLVSELFQFVKKRVDPEKSVLILWLSSIDRRSKLYRELTSTFPVSDLEVRSADQKGAKASIRSLVQEWVIQAGKRIRPRAVELLIDSVGTDPNALQVELSKILTGIGDRDTIEKEDVQRLCVRHKEEQLYEVTEAIATGDVRKALLATKRLLYQGVPPLVMLQVIHTFLQRLLLIREGLLALGIGNLGSYHHFQKTVFPGLKEYWGTPLPACIKGSHPYGIFRLAMHAKAFDRDFLVKELSGLVEIDLALKGGSKMPEIDLETLVLRLCRRIQDI